MEDLWHRIERWLRANAPDVLNTLRNGANEETIQKAESALGLVLPQSVKDFYSVHDGQQVDETGAVYGMVDGWELLSLARVVDQWSIWKDLTERGQLVGAVGVPDGPVLPDWWNTRWIPYTYSGLGDHHCIDMAPAAGGQKGQIILVYHDDASRPRIATGFDVWVRDYVNGLESGGYEFSEEYGGIIRK